MYFKHPVSGYLQKKLVKVKINILWANKEIIPKNHERLDWTAW